MLLPTTPLTRALLAVLLLGSVAWGVWAMPPSTHAEGTPRPDRYFGVAEAFRNLPAAIQMGAGWERLVFSWQHIQPESLDDWNEHYFPDEDLDRLRAAGMDVVGLLQDTPEWARLDAEAGATSVPVGLELAWDDPENSWGQFVYTMAARYRGRIDSWIIWNEPEFRPSDQGGLYFTFSGDDHDYYRLLKVAHQAARAANPEVTIVFGATSYWIDRVNGRSQFLERILDLASLDPEAEESGGFFDAVAINLYWSVDDIRRLSELSHAALEARGFGGKRLWITETNAMPYDDPLEPKPRNGMRVTLDEQAAFVLHAYATALASGYERVAWHAMVDRDTSDEIWGLARNDGTLRPAYTAYRTATTWLSGSEAVTWAPLLRARPLSATGEFGTVQVDRVVLTRKGGQRVTVLWNATGEEMRVAVPRAGAMARVLNRSGVFLRMAAPLDADSWELSLPAATAHAEGDPDGYFVVGGEPLLLVEDGVAPNAPVLPIRQVP